MKIAFVGVGAVGGYFGGRMAEHGLDAVFLARPQTARALREGGLRVESILGDFSIERPNVCADPAAAGPVDVLFLAVKASQVTAAAEFSAPATGKHTTAIPLQNGVDAPRAAAAVLGQERVLGGLSRIFSEKTAPGRIRHSDIRPSIAFGELAGGISERAARIAEHLEPVAAMDAQASADIVTDMWKKLMLVASLGAAGAAARAPVGIVRSVAETRALLQEAAGEIAAVGRAVGADIPADFAERCLFVFDKLIPETTASMHRDLARGVPSELDEQVGAVIRYGRANAVGTPTLDALHAALLPGELRARGEIGFDDVPAPPSPGQSRAVR